MKERPILFQGAMVRALLDGSKTQTRRLCKQMNMWVNQECREVRNIDGSMLHFLKWAATPMEELHCPYGKPGDRLWVRESFWGCDLPGYGDQPCVVYDDEWIGKDYKPTEPRPWARKFGRIPSIHMPRDCSRILLEIVSVRVERLTDISEEDARAEGITDGGCLNCGESEPCKCTMPMPDARDAYCNLWGQINGANSWGANPWVWVVDFKRVAP